MRVVPIEGLNAMAWTMFTVSFLLMIGRFYIQNKKNWRVGWDGYLHALAIVFLLETTILYELFVPIEYNAKLYDMGLSEKPPTNRNAALNLKLNLATTVSFLCVIYTVKGSLLALYWRIFELSQGFRYAWIAVTAYTVITFLASALSIFFMCGSPSDIDLAHCEKQSHSLYMRVMSFLCATNALGDLLLMLLPLMMLKPLHMPATQKIGMGFMFSLSLLTITFNVLRIVYAIDTKPEFAFENGVWCLLEPNMAAIICALPCYRSYLSLLVPEKFASTFNSIMRRFSKNKLLSQLISIGNSETLGKSLNESTMLPQNATQELEC
ncbi:hypothetical protein DM02DRAFT_657609 [Periconia macrospinosa]|uniref:Rhodopsin domain-containing protein n=1 Tax=Periconia macrospinosa TaxID=97972 RepID=A0A2V1DJ30_9PLEO|nr:hypothetical protein DM02DRAFT_657609 [Periconia macrospinosa]